MYDCWKTQPLEPILCSLHDKRELLQNLNPQALDQTTAAGHLRPLEGHRGREADRLDARRGDQGPHRGHQGAAEHSEALLLTLSFRRSRFRVRDSSNKSFLSYFFPTLELVLWHVRNYSPCTKCRNLKPEISRTLFGQLRLKQTRGNEQRLVQTQYTSAQNQASLAINHANGRHVTPMSK